MVIIDPDLNCHSCSQRQLKHEEVPLCMTDEGCPIEAEATDPNIHRLITGYSNYKQLNSAGAPDSLQLECLERCGATELCPALLVEMEPVYNKMVEKLREEHKVQQEETAKYKDKVSAAKRKARGR